MKIMITHIPNTLNFGSAMMATNLIYYLNKYSNEKMEFYADTRNKEDLENLLKWTNLSNIKVNKILPDKSKFKVKSLNSNKKWIDEYCNGIVNYYDYFIVLGGDDLSEYYSKELVVNELYKIYKISEIIPVFLIGQTIGPFTEWRKEYASRMLKKCKIYTRDLVTYKYLKGELKIDNIIKSADLAFLNLPMQVDFNANSILKSYNVSEDEYITLVPSGLIDQYTKDYESYIKNWEEIISYLIENYSGKIILVPHVLRPEKYDDRIIIDELIKRNKEKYFNRVIYLKDITSPLEARIILGSGKFTITGRMHSAVSTFQMGKPAISLSYSVKYAGVIGDALDCKELIVECKDYTWKEKDVARVVIKKIKYLEENYIKLSQKIKNNINNCKNKVNDSINDILNKINGI